MLKETLFRARALYEEEKFDDALSVIESYGKNCDLSPNLLVLKGRLIQLADGGRFELQDAQQAFLEALEHDNCHIVALLELGWFYLNVCDDASKAATYFGRVTKICVELEREAQEGKKKCEQEDE